MLNMILLLTLVTLSVEFACSQRPKRDSTVQPRDATGDGDPFTSVTPSRTLQWTPCYEGMPDLKGYSFSCARFLAPLDFANASAGDVQLAILRLKGSGAGDAVFYNPGGPGDDPVADTLSKAPLLRTYVGNDSDIIAIVPRGVGSTFPPITCDATIRDATQRLWQIQDTIVESEPPALTESYAIGESLGLDCGLVRPDLVPYVGTIAAAHDMDVVRDALGQAQISYLGFSYGTVLGGTYAALFPDRVKRMVLDGVLDFNDYYAPDKNASLDIGDAGIALANFFQSCHNAKPHACAIWSASIKDIEQRFYEADRQIYDEPLPVPGLGLLTWPLWRSAVYSALYRPTEGFPLLAGSIAEILKGSAGPNIQAYIEIVQNAASSTDEWPIDPKSGLKNSSNAAYFISCSDSGGSSRRLATEDLGATFSQYQKVNKYFAGISAQYDFICLGANLSAKATSIGEFKNITTSTPILFVGNTADPTTPIRSAHRISEAFPGSGVLTIKGTGHLSFNAVENTECPARWVSSYFRDGKLPPNGTVCDGMQMPFASSDED